ncbi:MAG: hypothetical protein QM754_11510 [Tepidisphaeraceae bacterium]
MALTLPKTDNGLLSFALNFKTLITAAPTTYGLTAAQATAYGTVVTTYANALAACDPGIRSATAVAAKNTARDALKLASDQTANLINGTPSVTDAQKVALGIPPRAKPTPIPAPSTPPSVEIISVSGWNVKVGLRTSSTDAKRRKPAGVAGATVMSYVGPTPSNDMSKWKYEGMSGKTIVEVTFPITVPPGSQVWLTAFWFNNRKQTGPAAQPIGTNLQGGTVSMAA